MEIIPLTDETQEFILAHTEQTIRAGGIVVAPTDTVYGIVGDATREVAIQKMFAAKERVLERAFPIFVRNIQTARRYASISDTKAKCLEKIWPGQVTALFDRKGNLPDLLTGGDRRIGMRMPNHSFLQKLLLRFDAPLAQTSANISGMPPAKNRDGLIAYFENKKVQPDLIIDAGVISGAPSTIIDMSGDAPIFVRTGLMTKSQVDEIFKTML